MSERHWWGAIEGGIRMRQLLACAIVCGGLVWVGGCTSGAAAGRWAQLSPPLEPMADSAADARLAELETWNDAPSTLASADEVASRQP